MYHASKSFCEFEPYKLNLPNSNTMCASFFLLFDRKHLEKVLKKSWSTITLGWFVFALLLASRLLLLGKQTMGWRGGQNSLSGLHVHASANQFFLPGTNTKRLEYRLLTSAPGWSHGKHFGILTQRSGVRSLSPAVFIHLMELFLSCMNLQINSKIKRYSVSHQWQHTP